LVEGEHVPACFPNINGMVLSRGQMTLFPVPARGGALLAIFPYTNDEKNCSCTPEEQDVVLTSTAFSESEVLPNGVPDVCIVRLRISKDIYADVNSDLFINQEDINLVINSTYFSMNPDPTLPSPCPNTTFQSTTTYHCGPEDVNRDGLVNLLDVTSIQQSAVLGTAVPCGGIYATGFSCGSSRRAPLNPAVGISIDGMEWPGDEGLLAEGFALPHMYDTRSAPSTRLLDDILVEFDSLSHKTRDLEATVEQLKATDEHMAAQMRSSQEQSSSHSLLIDVGISIAAVGVCAAIVFVVTKRRHEKTLQW
jgi:hypothetical protein